MNRVIIDPENMQPNKVYEIDTSQGPIQCVKGDDGVVTVYEIYILPEGIDSNISLPVGTIFKSAWEGEYRKLQ